MKDLFKKWWFWAIVIIVILVLLFFPLKACGLIAIGEGGTPTGETVNVYISYFQYFAEGCIE